MQLLSFNIVGTGAALALADGATGVPKKCKWFQVLNVDGAAFTLGGSTVDATHGYPIGTTVANFQPPIALGFDFYDLESIFFFLTTSANAVLLCAI